MNAQTFNRLITDPLSALQQVGGQALDDFLKEHPYCQAVHALAARKAYEQKLKSSEKYLHKAAAYAYNRDRLRELVQGRFATLEQTQQAFKKQLEQQEAAHAAVSQEAQQRQATAQMDYTIDHAEDEEASFFDLLESSHPAQSNDSSIADTTFSQSIEQQVAEAQKDKPLTDLEQTLAALRKSRENFFKRFSDEQQTEKKDIEPVSADKGASAPPLDQMSLINRFLEKEPSMPSQKPLKQKIEEKTEDLAAGSTVIKVPVASENLAKLLARQGKKDKAIEIYRRLELKYPDKSSYFAEIIQNLK